VSEIISVIIVSWNTRDMLRECLTSLFAQPTGVPFVTYVVDNASTDGSAEMVQVCFPQVVLIRNPENVGFAKANNQVLSQINTPYALLLNSDTLIPQIDLFGPWIEFMERNPMCAASGCRLVFPDGSQQVGDAGYKPTLRSIISHALFLSRIFPTTFKGIFLTGVPGGGKPVEVDWVCGAALMVRMSAVKQVGLMDDSFFMFAEDIEWGCRMREHGFKVFYLPALFIVHYQGASSKKQKAKKFSGLWLRNVRKIFERYNPGIPGFWCDFFMGLGLLLRSVIYLILGKKFASKSKRMFHYFEALVLGKD